MTHVSSRKIVIRHEIPAEYELWQRKWLAQLPELEQLTRGLTRIFSSVHPVPVCVLDRQINMSWSSSPTEIVTCALADGRELRVLCKYVSRERQRGERHQRGIEHEARVYQSVLRGLTLPTATFHGFYRDADSDLQFMALEYLSDGVRLHKLLEPGAPQLAAQWIGEFHATLEQRRSDHRLSFLSTYDAEYYRGWTARTAEFTGVLLSRYPWLADLCTRTSEWSELLLSASPTVIHGEFYPDNVVVQGGVPRPVDWESAAIAPGEIDLACLTSGAWSPEIVRECEAEYRRVRWSSSSPPAAHESLLAAARIYLHFRWLGDSRDQATGERIRWRFEQLRLDAERLQLL